MKGRGPQLISADELRDWDCSANVEKNVWVAARPLHLGTIRERFKLAWNVFTGKYDALKWYKQ